MRKIVMVDAENIEKFSGLYFGSISNHFNKNTICYGMLDDYMGKKNVPVALLMADFIKRDLMINWMYVAKPYRNQHIMTELLTKLIDNARNTKIIKTIECVVTDEEIAGYLSTQFGFYYDSFGEKGVMNSTLGSLVDLSKNAKDNNPAKRLIDIDEMTINKLNKYFLVNQNIPVGVELPIKAEDYSILSMAVVENGEIKALLLIDKNDDDLVISYAYAKEGSGHLLMYIVIALYKELSDLPSDKKVVAAVLNEQSRNLFLKLFKDCSIKRLYECEYIL